MDHTTLGRSGLVGSRRVLGMMSYGDSSRRAWHLDLDRARPAVRRAVDADLDDRTVARPEAAYRPHAGSGPE
jgi:aryl-alcohol dehydrogenase-like predicted oxidoreductase